MNLARGKIFVARPLSLIGMMIILSFAVVALLAPALAPPTSKDPYLCPYTSTSDYLIPPPTLPSPGHPFGTLHGYDLYYGCIWGIRTAFYISVLTTLLAVIIGFSIGSIAGYFGGLLDELLMRFTDAFFALPGLVYVLLVLAAISGRGGALNLQISSIDKIILALATIGWPPYARLTRSEIKRVKEQDFVEAAKAIGCSPLRVLIRHVLPNSVNPVIALAFLNVGGVLLAASTVSFLGFGPDVGYAEWGSIIANSRSHLVFTAATSQFVPLLFIPAAFLSAFVLGWTLLEDALIFIIDPTLRGRLYL